MGLPTVDLFDYAYKKIASEEVKINERDFIRKTLGYVSGCISLKDYLPEIIIFMAVSSYFVPGAIDDMIREAEFTKEITEYDFINLLTQLDGSLMSRLKILPTLLLYAVRTKVSYEEYQKIVKEILEEGE